MLTVSSTTFFALITIFCAAMAAKIPLLESIRSNPTEEDNTLTSNVEYPEVSRAWVKLTIVPPANVRRLQGVPLELDCEASGSPAPTIRWLRDNIPITEAEDYESSNMLPESGSNQMAKVRSRLIINNITPMEKNTYTCVAQAESKTTYYSTTVITPQGGFPKPQNYTEYLMLNKEILAAPSKPKIVLYYKTVMENIGNTLIVPCKVIGNPRPDIYWIDNEDSVISHQHPRFKIMSTGELVIRGLRWADMGSYTCVAKNPISKDTITTFVYPMLNEKK